MSRSRTVDPFTYEWVDLGGGFFNMSNNKFSRRAMGRIGVSDQKFIFSCNLHNHIIQTIIY